MANGNQQVVMGLEIKIVFNKIKTNFCMELLVKECRTKPVYRKSQPSAAFRKIYPLKRKYIMLNILPDHIES